MQAKTLKRRSCIIKKIQVIKFICSTKSANPDWRWNSTAFPCKWSQPCFHSWSGKRPRVRHKFRYYLLTGIGCQLPNLQTIAMVWPRFPAGFASEVCCRSQNSLTVCRIHFFPPFRLPTHTLRFCRFPTRCNLHWAVSPRNAAFAGCCSNDCRFPNAIATRALCRSVRLLRSTVRQDGIA